MILLQEVAQDPVPFAERRVAQVVPQLEPPLAQGRGLLVRQVMVQLRQHHQGQELYCDLRGLDEAFELVGVVIEAGEGLLVGVGNRKGVVFADQAAAGRYPWVKAPSGSRLSQGKAVLVTQHGGGPPGATGRSAPSLCIGQTLPALEWAS